MSRHALPHTQRGRHRYGRGDRIYCRELPAARDFYAMHARPRRWWRMFTFSRSRHSFEWMRQTGQQPRPAFALIMSL